MFVFLSCDPEKCLVKSIRNKTETDLYFNVAGSTPDLNDKILIESGSFKYWGQKRCAKVEVIINFSNYDSIYLESEGGNIFKVYKPGDDGKTVYNLDFWERNFSKDESEYIFEITEEELGTSETGE